jgi:hypothetical protein
MTLQIFPLDIFRELQAVTPDSFQYLLHDRFQQRIPCVLRRVRGARRKQTITVTVPQKPARAGIDPRQLLSDGKDQEMTSRPGSR